MNAIFQRAGVTDSGGNPLRTITTLNTGLGTHDITVNLTGSSQGALFNVNTEGPFISYPAYPNASTINASGSTVPLIIFGGQGQSTITGGSGSDIIFAHRGQVIYDNSQNQPVTILGNGGPGDTNNGFDLPPSRIATIDLTTGTTTILAGPSHLPDHADPDRRRCLWHRLTERLEHRLRRGPRRDHRRHRQRHPAGRLRQHQLD